MKTVIADVRLAIVVPDNIPQSEYAAYAADVINESVREQTMAFSDNSAILDYEVGRFADGPEIGGAYNEGDAFDDYSDMPPGY